MKNKNNKFPILLVMIFALSLGVQVLFDSQEPHAKNATPSQKSFAELAERLKGQAFTDSKGQEINLDRHVNDLVLINFWASWCQPCLEEIPSLVNFSQTELGKKVLIIAINGDEENSKLKAQKVIDKNKMNFSNVWDFEGKIYESLGISAVPVTIIIKKGKVLKHYKEPVDFEAEEFKEEIRGWLSL